MILLKKQSPVFERVIGRHKARSGVDYLPSVFCLKMETDEGTLLYNTLTDEMVLADEAAECRELAAGRFLVPAGTDEIKLVEDCRRLEQALEKAKQRKGMKNAVILTTTGCNARCFYCFEKGCKAQTMDEKTAEAAADYIARHRNPEEDFHINWFGGEPLLNTRAMDRISQGLKERGIPFHASLITNGYLLNEENILKATENWNVTSAQITLDGLAETYNKIKAYLYQKDSNPFETVLKNIAALTRSGIRVDIRMNLSLENGEELEGLIELLRERFGGNELLYPYVRILYQQSTADALWQKQKQLKDKIRRSFPESRKKQSPLVKFSACGADSGTSLTIMPDGKLLCCEHFTERPEAVGSIFSEEINEEIVLWWREPKPWEESCKSCFYAPKCYKLAHCPESGNCHPGYREEMREDITRFMQKVYEERRSTK